MVRTIAAIAAALTLLLAACGDDDDGDATPTLAPTPSGETPAETEEPTEEPDGDDETDAPDDGDDKPSPGDTGDGGTPVPTAPGEVPTAPPPAAEGTPAVQPADETGFLAQFQGQDVQIEQCAYNPGTALTSCGERGLYAIDPPIVGQDIQCSVWLVDGTPRAIQCRSAEPLQTRTYEIQS